jgi:hypothetical protein
MSSAKELDRLQALVLRLFWISRPRPKDKRATFMLCKHEIIKTYIFRLLALTPEHHGLTCCLTSSEAAKHIKIGTLFKLEECALLDNIVMIDKALVVGHEGISAATFVNVSRQA